VISDRLPTLGASPVELPRGRRLVGRALARPSLPALVGLVVVLVFFGLQTPELLSPGGLASVLDPAALLGIGGVAVALLLIAGQFDLSIGVTAVASSLVTALLISQAGWNTWAALLGSLAVALLVGLVNGFLVVNTGLPSFLVTLVVNFALNADVRTRPFNEETGTTGVVGFVRNSAFCVFRAYDPKTTSFVVRVNE